MNTAATLRLFTFWADLFHFSNCYLKVNFDFTDNRLYIGTSYILYYCYKDRFHKLLLELNLMYSVLTSYHESLLTICIYQKEGINGEYK